MKKIVISSSMRFRDKIKETISRLEGLGYIGIFPNIDSENENENDSMTLREKDQLAWDHYNAIENCDAIYFILPNGYMGTSCKLELGYALAMKKPIYFSELTNDIGLDSYPRKIISMENLEEFKEEFSQPKI